MTFQISPRVHLAWPSVPSCPCEMTFEKYIRGNLADIHHLALGHQRGNIYLDISHARCTRDDFSNLTSHPSCMAKCPFHHTKVLMWDAREMIFKSHLVSILRGQVSPPLHKSSHARCTLDDFSNLTSCPSCVAKCPLHHTKVLMWDAFEMIFKSHLVFILHGQVSPPLHKSSHVRYTLDDFSNLTSCPSCVAKCPLHHTKVLTWDAHEMTFQISPCIHLAWPSVPSTTPKFSRDMHARWLFKSHLASI